MTDLCSSANNCCNATECTNSSLASSPAALQHNESQPSYQLIKEFLFTVPAGPSSPYLVSVITAAPRGEVGRWLWVLWVKYELFLVCGWRS